MTHAAVIRAANARVVIFPELSMTGYELESGAISVDDSRLAPIVDACAEMGCLALVGAPVDTGRGRPEIALVGVDGAGATVAYSKIWLHGGGQSGSAPDPSRPLSKSEDGALVLRSAGIPAFHGTPRTPRP